jgi:hypothetical protein
MAGGRGPRQDNGALCARVHTHHGLRRSVADLLCCLSTLNVTQPQLNTDPPPCLPRGNEPGHQTPAGAAAAAADAAARRCAHTSLWPCRQLARWHSWLHQRSGPEQPPHRMSGRPAAAGLPHTAHCGASAAAAGRAPAGGGCRKAARTWEAASSASCQAERTLRPTTREVGAAALSGGCCAAGPAASAAWTAASVPAATMALCASAHGRMRAMARRTKWRVLSHRGTRSSEAWGRVRWRARQPGWRSCTLAWLRAPRQRATHTHTHTRIHIHHKQGIAAACGRPRVLRACCGGLHGVGMWSTR